MLSKCEVVTMNAREILFSVPVVFPIYIIPNIPLASLLPVLHRSSTKQEINYS